jgi:hypothetical protein
MAADEGGDCTVYVVNAFSDESICVLKLPSSSTVLDVKRRVRASQHLSVFCQSLLVSPSGHQVEDHEVLATLPGLRLQLVKLKYVDDDANGIRCLLRAAREGGVHEVQRLLRLPLRPDCIQAGVTALMMASENGHPEVVQLLCEAGADMDKADNDGFTALILASQRGHKAVAQLLCEAGADVDKADNDSATALIFAAKNGHKEAVQLLCEAGADMDKARDNGATALALASQSGHQEVVQLLCEAMVSRP